MPARCLGGNPSFQKGTRHGSASTQVYKLKVLKSLTSYLIIIHSILIKCTETSSISMSNLIFGLSATRFLNTPS